MQGVLDWMWPAESPSNDAARGMEDAMEDAARGMETAMEDAARGMESAIKDALEDAERGNEIAEDCEKRLKTERDVARKRYHCAMTDHLKAEQWMRMPVGEIDVASAEDREKKMKAEYDVARSRYHFAKRRWQLTEQWKRDMEELGKAWEGDMQDLLIWEAATTNTCPERNWLFWKTSRDQAWRHIIRGSSSSEETVNALDLDPERRIDAASCARAARHLNREPEEADTPPLAAEEELQAEETPTLPTPIPGLPTPLPIPGSDEDKEAFRSTLQKRRKTNEGGGFEIDGRERSISEMPYDGECATLGCRRERQFPDGCDWECCCKECFVTEGESHEPWCDYANEFRLGHIINLLNATGPGPTLQSKT